MQGLQSNDGYTVLQQAGKKAAGIGKLCGDLPSSGDESVIASRTRTFEETAKETTMTTYTVGLKLRARSKAVTIDAEDALVAALRTKLDNPEALITYVRKANRRGDRRHPHEALTK
jgi:hypothetical protein